MTRRRLLILFAVAAFLCAGMLSYLADSSPDGLEAATARGCAVVEVDGSATVTGECPAGEATDHPWDAGPLAGYTVGGHTGSTGVAGVLGVAVTSAVAAALFRLLVRRRGASGNRTPGARP
ncbi:MULTISPECIES: PDGLE domain-containing protein [unclassified Rhodococcus (in: high G+C Gram-positive bacteria)]|uniref:PDGLE domain-containing protein n=1 Tax=unclassified Rhodococcus (in: high G+C Gram-positive bacteria) TaxID=192944 RepID=UPI00092708DE|nr:PDGLE domain-containing protein [Rhodococcus sp. M8]OLL20375.1 hypothetical protein BKE56_010700 [Rhodococcus sp. M8]QPG44222.1 PDGLE domain-containing protein [Rhodococcus sp. M8]